MTESDSPDIDHVPFGPAVALTIVFGIYVAFDVFAALANWEPEELFWAVMCGVLILQPLAMGLWTALADGSLVVRLPIVVGCLLLLCTIPGIIRSDLPELQLRDFLAAVLITLVLFLGALLASLAVRRFGRLRLELFESTKPRGSAMQFSTRYLLGLTALYAIVLGMMSQLTFAKSVAVPGPLFPFLFISILLRVIPTFAVTLLPTLAVPFWILSGRVTWRSAVMVIVLWFFATLLPVAYWQSESSEPWPHMLALMLLAQLGGAIAGAVSAIPLTAAGYRLVRTTGSAESGAAS